MTQMRGAQIKLRCPHDTTTQTPTAAVNQFYFIIRQKRKMSIHCQKLHIKFINGVLTVGQCTQSGI